MVFQRYAVFPHMTVAENLSFPLRMPKLPAPRIRERVAWGLGLVQLAVIGAITLVRRRRTEESP